MNEWYKKESPVQGLSGLWGGVCSNLNRGLSYEGDSQYTNVTTGTYSWSVPFGVTSISILTVGGGAGGPSNGAGGTGWYNNYPVSFGQTFTLGVGAPGGVNQGGGDSYFHQSTLVQGYGGSGQNGGTHVGQGGGNGGYAS